MTIKQLTVPASPECVLFQCNYAPIDQIAFYGYYTEGCKNDIINTNRFLVAAWKCKSLKPKTTQNA